MQPTDHPREVLVDCIRRAVADADPCDRAETYLLAEAVVSRLAEVGVRPDQDVAVAFMAAAMLLAEGSPEWGGNYRDALARLARIGFDLMARAEQESPPGLA
ncbi:MAG TPA: hypothetical protein VFH45_01760 [Acidimicrobiales bacterium]|nr:hypothetical protein [Acidimicrobiales bacterium]